MLTPHPSHKKTITRIIKYLIFNMQGTHNIRNINKALLSVRWGMSFITCIVVGSILFSINYLDILITHGSLTTGQALKSILSYAVPFATATFGQIFASYDQISKEREVDYSNIETFP